MKKVKMDIYCDERLKAICDAAATEEGVPLSDWVVKVLAPALGRPDLAEIPRKPLGRKRKELSVSA